MQTKNLKVRWLPLKRQVIINFKGNLGVLVMHYFFQRELYTQEFLSGKSSAVHLAICISGIKCILKIKQKE